MKIVNFLATVEENKETGCPAIETQCVFVMINPPPSCFFSNADGDEADEQRREAFAGLLNSLEGTVQDFFNYEAEISVREEGSFNPVSCLKNIAEACHLNLKDKVNGADGFSEGWKAAHAKILAYCEAAVSASFSNPPSGVREINKAVADAKLTEIVDGINKKVTGGSDEKAWPDN